MKFSPSGSDSNEAPKYEAIWSGLLLETNRPHMLLTVAGRACATDAVLVGVASEDSVCYSVNRIASDPPNASTSTKQAASGPS